ncbi:MAG TPA: 3-oxoacyl-ACP reductase family protein [Pseudomonadota bacterium]|jgi:3-oxoacyl-[acyl-carrier protein] reductase|nr:3-oxoacyl-ACP reductase family protein [Pseudomonadota bacterium]HNK43962.1 3-oxoacyl-ACP reductase family protein [Pseudomonadota bacterium]HNN50377.1 3-oxoacyl-ACP reductase family protein [Pseudomonadota bacterium]
MSDQTVLRGLLHDRVAVVTGAGRGIGRVCATTLVSAGASVIINDLDAEPAAEAVAECHAIRPGSAVASIGSVTDPKYTDELMKAAVDRFGKLDILVNNAGLSRDKMCHLMPDEWWDLVIDVNLTGTFNCIRSAAPHIREVAKRELEELGQPRYNRKIVNFFSTAAIRGNPGQINYVAAKMGNVGITRVVAQEWARFHVNVNAVAPGFTETRMTAAKKPGDVLGVPEEQRQATLQKIPMGRFGQPQDIANAVLFFSSPLSDYVTGQTINVSGGMQIP